MKKVLKTSKNIKGTGEIAKVFLGTLFKNLEKQKGAVVVGLSGDLGAGKTAFTQAILKHLGVKGKVSSPTFVIIKKYVLKKSKTHKFFFHIDAYRLKNEQELLVLKWEEIIKNPEHIIFIEWPENVKKAMPKNSKFIYISTNENGHREFKFN